MGLTTSLKAELPHPNINMRVSFPAASFVRSSRNGRRYVGVKNQSKLISGPSLLASAPWNVEHENRLDDRMLPGVLAISLFPGLSTLQPSRARRETHQYSCVP